MDIIINLQELHDMINKVYEENNGLKKAIGKSGKIWIYGKLGGNIHVSADKRELSPGYGGFKGYGGSTLTFKLEDGTIEKLQAPWHSNSDALFADTGIDLRDKHPTIVIICKDRGRTKLPGYCCYQDEAKDVLYVDTEPVIGEFHRGTKLAMDFAKKLNQVVYRLSVSQGGSSFGPVYPNQIDIHGRKSNDPEELKNLTNLARYITLIDGAYDIVELWDAKTPAQKEWKEGWLREAQELGAEPDV